jgi:hypothetical protein
MQEISQRVLSQTKPSTKELTLASGLAAVYIVSSFLPLTPFIGGPAFITLAIVMVPVIAALLRPLLATLTIAVGALGMLLAQTSLFQVFGFPGLLIPVGAVALGSLAFHYKQGPILPWTYVLVGAIFYVTFSNGGTILWLIPYALVILSLPIMMRAKGTLRIGGLSLYAAMSEQVTMNILSIAVLGLVGPVWSVITPFMYSERALATLGGSAVIVALKSRFGGKIGLEEPRIVEVNR